MVVIVHAYADEPYDRSSFHLAGNAQPVAEVASMIAMQSIEGLASLPKQQEESESSRHPFVGLVDHISVMPLVTVNEADEKGGITSAHGEAAKIVGERLKKIGVQVFYYGDAHPEGTLLAVVRRERTNFFKTGGLETTIVDEHKSFEKGVATVGAPSTFVENFNIRLTSNCDLKTARSLTKLLRERDGGLVGFEGLTLPYSNDRYEVAGNLLQPEVGSSEAVVAKLDEWVEQKLKELPFDEKTDLVDEAYRVGTTKESCLDALELCDTAAGIARHDQQVTQRFQKYLTELPHSA